MNQIDFSFYLKSIGTEKKVISDHISRIKRIERSICSCDIDEEYHKDKCSYLLCLFANKGENEQLKKVIVADLPIGTYAMNTFRYSISKYIEFMNKSIK